MATLKEILTHRPVAGAIRFTLPAGVADAKYNKGVISKTLSKYFVNISSFIKKFNADTQNYKPETPIAVQVTVYKDRLFDMTYKSPHVAWYLKNAAGIELGTGDPGKVVAGTVSLKHVYEIAKIKRADPCCQYMSMESICKSIVGTANSMGIRVLEDLD